MTAETLTLPANAAQKAAPQDDKAKERKVNPANPGDVDLLEQKVVTYYHRAKDGVTIDDVSKPEYWANFVMKFRAGDRISVTAADGSWEGELSVRQVTKGGIIVEERIPFKKFTPIYKMLNTLSGAENDYSIQGVGGLYRIVRKSDGNVVIGDSYPDEPTAKNALRQFLGAK